MEAIEKQAGVLQVTASRPWPRWFTVRNIDTGSAVTGMTIEQVRDLHYMLGRAIALADEDDAKQQRDLLKQMAPR